MQFFWLPEYLTLYEYKFILYLSKLKMKYILKKSIEFFKCIHVMGFGMKKFDTQESHNRK